jgi:hypothetical protein
MNQAPFSTDCELQQISAVFRALSVLRGFTAQDVPLAPRVHADLSNICMKFLGKN